MPDANEVVCVAQFTAKDGHEKELLHAMRGLIETTRAEPRCIRYELNVALENERVITFIEKFTSREAFDWHCNTPYIKTFFDQVAPPLMDAVTVTLYREITP